jgi:exopolysaccharide production protein ExoQ
MTVTSHMHGDRHALRFSVAALLAFMALAALILDPLFGSRAALVFLVCGILLMATRPESSVHALARYWYLLILPAYCLVSTLWSQFPEASLRYSVQLALTMAVAIVVATRVSPGKLLHCLFGIYAIGVVGSMVFGKVREDIGAWVGIFHSKNEFAGVVSGFVLTAAAVLFDRSAPRPMRFAAFAGLIVSGPLLLKAQSAGAILTLLPAVALSFFILSSRRLTSKQKLVVCAALALLGIALAAVVVSFGDVLFAALLDYSGKDVSLTGRTDLWESGRQIIAEHPILGVGYQAFWVQGYAPAEALWWDFGIESRMGFHFHNMYISNAVEIGLLGLAIEMLLLYSALVGALLWAVRSPLPENAFLASFVTMTVCSTFTEVPVFFQFNITSLIVTCTLVYAARARLAQRGLTPARLWDHAAGPGDGGEARDLAR